MNGVLNAFYPFEVDGNCFLFTPDTVSLYKVSRPAYEAAKRGEVKDLPSARNNTASNADPEHGEMLKEIYIQIIHDCNLDCKYCYAGGGYAYLSLCKKNDIMLNDRQDCELSLHTAKLALQIYAAVKMNNPKLWDAFFRQELPEAS
jgi:hypothetical protein